MIYDPAAAPFLRALLWLAGRSDAGDGEKLVGMAVEAIKRDIRDAMRANRSENAAGRKLDPTTANPSEEKRRYAARTRPIIRRLTRLLSDVQKAAARFGIERTTLSLTDAMAGVNALQAGMYERARAYAEAVEQVRVLGDSAMANAAGTDLVPAGVLADDIDERGGDASALRDAFAA